MARLDDMLKRESDAEVSHNLNHPGQSWGSFRLHGRRASSVCAGPHSREGDDRQRVRREGSCRCPCSSEEGHGQSEQNLEGSHEYCGPSTAFASGNPARRYTAAAFDVLRPRGRSTISISSICGPSGSESQTPELAFRGPIHRSLHPRFHGPECPDPATTGVYRSCLTVIPLSFIS
jgi:hypothetical protein